MAGSSQTTTDHNTIRKWAEERSAWPATVKGTGDKESAGVLRLDFEEDGKEDERDSRLERISWEEFFEKFDESNLAFLFQETLKSGEVSRFFKFVQREGTDPADDGRGRNQKSAGKSEKKSS
jgi:hypothetical protein